MAYQKDAHNMKNRAEGFTLMEIVVTTIIVGVIASFAFSNYTIVIERHRAKEAEQMLYAILAEQKRCQLEDRDGGLGSCALPSEVSQYSENFPRVGTSTATFDSGESSFCAVWRTGVDVINVSTVEGVVGGNPGRYVLYIVHGGPVGSAITIQCKEGPHAIGLCKKLGY